MNDPKTEREAKWLAGDEGLVTNEQRQKVHEAIARAITAVEAAAKDELTKLGFPHGQASLVVIPIIWPDAREMLSWTTIMHSQSVLFMDVAELFEEKAKYLREYGSVAGRPLFTVPPVHE
jgi:hypothetical protein